MSSTVEAYRLRSLCFEWEKRIPDGTCDRTDTESFRKGECSTCFNDDIYHEIKRCVRELRALMATSQEPCDE